MTTVPAAWMPCAALKRIIVHWMAGSHQAKATDRPHYHVLTEGDVSLMRGSRPISTNVKGGQESQASHTLSCNTESIGVVLSCMRVAVERPFDAGPSPSEGGHRGTGAVVVRGADPASTPGDGARNSQCDRASRRDAHQC
ncbi:MAG: hypothetical protein LCH88_15565 [Proteobacteria bacterium]|nr:hypothetical protein [Pseudomonadota bacterium]